MFSRYRWLSSYDRLSLTAFTLKYLHTFNIPQTKLQCLLYLPCLFCSLTPLSMLYFCKHINYVPSYTEIFFNFYFNLCYCPIFCYKYYFLLILCSIGHIGASISLTILSLYWFLILVNILNDTNFVNSLEFKAKYKDTYNWSSKAV